MNYPKHVAIIMDGNGRWGITKKKSRNFGHKKGLQTVEKIISIAIKHKINFLTLYVFSTENWKRPTYEINYLFNLLEKYIDKEVINLINKGIKIKIIGNLNKIPLHLIKKLKKVEKITKKNTKLQINVAFNYGSRHEILHAVNKIHKKKNKI